MHEKSITEIDLKALTAERVFHPSPESWGDQVLYFLLVDRFSDGRESEYKDSAGKFVRREGGTPRFRRGRDTNNAVGTPEDARRWREAGDSFVGGNLKGLAGKLGYLKRLGVTTLWISPVLKQACWDDKSYHGYAIQNFLAVDPRFGTRDELRELTQQAHALGMYVLLDAIVNHCGDAFAYGEPGKGEYCPAYTGEQYPVLGFRNQNARPTLPFGPIDLNRFPDAWPEAALWPAELQSPETFTRKGQIRNWDASPEFEQGDFFALKDLNLGASDENGEFHPSPVLETLIAAYQFWIAYTDLDGFRLDTVKHMGQGATTYFVRRIHEFARSLGKERFLIVGEITGGRENALEMLEATDLDAALTINELPSRMRGLVTGHGDACAYFQIFDDLLCRELENPTAWRERLVTLFDDHDQVGRPVKARFAAEFGEDRRRAVRAVLAVLGVNATTLGIPCIYYGTEQGFNGHAQTEEGGDRYVREAMFGGEFGSFGSRGRHFFNEGSRLYRGMAKLLALRRDLPALRRGRQYIRELSEDGNTFGVPGEGPGIVAWSRLLDADEVLCVLNSDFDRERSIWVTIDAERHPPGSRPLKCLYATDRAQIGTETGAPEARNGTAVQVTVPPGGFAIYV